MISLNVRQWYDSKQWSETFVIIGWPKKIILVEALKKCFYRAGNIPGTIIIHILEVSPPVRKPLSLLPPFHSEILFFPVKP